MIIATRVLMAICKDGEHRPVVLRIEAPVQDPDGRWRCWYEIETPVDGWPAEVHRHSVASALDSLAALQTALMLLGGDIHFISYHAEGKLYWHEGQIGYGVMVHKSARDLLRGEDKEFMG